MVFFLVYFQIPWLIVHSVIFFLVYF
jgi:hypothetical protein